ncbi:hypothetical protein DFJ73DRAFT_469371 [Zopfochytrium polystomum]|nr:hypothetical protein DFJ73DRAFT_469371 [Zopfochytrium polystomum]
MLLPALAICTFRAISAIESSTLVAAHLAPILLFSLLSYFRPFLSLSLSLSCCLLLASTTLATRTRSANRLSRLSRNPRPAYHPHTSSMPHLLLATFFSIDAAADAFLPPSPSPAASPSHPFLAFRHTHTPPRTHSFAFRLCLSSLSAPHPLPPPRHNFDCGPFSLV